MKRNGRNMYVFRDGRHSVSGVALAEALASRLRNLCLSNPLPASNHEYLSIAQSDADALVMDALLRAGELECALTDLGSPEAERLGTITDALATKLVGCSCGSGENLLSLLPRVVPPRLSLSPPEGFAFYALHPLDFADLAQRVPVQGGTAAVVGIRTIGSTLSAVVSAALQARGFRAERITVRPAGHPYDRHTDFTPQQLRWITERRAHEATFLVVDEGPGMSGSSFLSVGEALLSAGVPRSRIFFLCSRQPDVNTLCARDGAARWQSFQSIAAAPATRIPEEAKVYIGGGYWRHELIGFDPAGWPASWSQMERLKFLSADRRSFFKFEGLGRFGSELRDRAQLLQDAGYGVAPSALSDGFAVYPLIKGETLVRGGLNRGILERIGAYCALRAREFISGESGDMQAMQTMVRFDLSEEFGIDLDAGFQLGVERPVLADGRMLPEEWLQPRDSSELIKCDAISHGDDHFFPGPATDICWDLAGAIVEWDMPCQAREYLLEQYRRASGDDPRNRLPAYLLAYSTFRMAYCKMAAEAMRGSEEEERLLNAYHRYRAHVSTLLPHPNPRNNGRGSGTLPQEIVAD